MKEKFSRLETKACLKFLRGLFDGTGNNPTAPISRFSMLTLIFNGFFLRFWSAR